MRYFTASTYTALLTGVTSLLAVNSVAHAGPGDVDTVELEGSSEFSDFASFVDLILTIIDTAIIPFLFAVAFVGFLYGIYKYFFFSDNERNRQQGRQWILAGIVGMTVMMLMWGLVNVVANTFFTF
jgi:hypothetical protein